MRSFGDLVTARRKELGISGKELADRIGIHDTQLSRWIGKRGVPRRRLRDAAKWCEALHLSGYAAERLIDAMHLAAATNRIREMIEKRDRDVASLRAENERLERRLASIQRVANGSEPPLDPRA